MPNFRNLGLLVIACLATLATLGAITQGASDSQFTRLSWVEASRVDGGAPCKGVTTKYGEDNGCSGKCKVQNNTVDAGGEGNYKIVPYDCYEPEGNLVKCGSLQVSQIKCDR